MKQLLSLLAFGLLAAAIAFGQATNGTSTTPQTNASPPVTSQTPATSTSPTTGASPQAASPANNNGMTEGQANPQTGQSAASSASNQGANSPATTSPNASQTSPNSATMSNSPQSQADCTKTHPLYECQATDIPWATAGAGNNGTPNPRH